jgi:hypothetical protein
MSVRLRIGSNISVFFFDAGFAASHINQAVIRCTFFLRRRHYSSRSANDRSP